MRSVLLLVAFVVAMGAGAFAHEGNDHVRGVVVKIQPEWSTNSITVRTTDNEIRTLTVTDKTAFKQGKKTVQLTDLKVGDRVVVDVPAKTARATLVQIADAPAAPAAKAPATK